MKFSFFLPVRTGKKWVAICGLMIIPAAFLIFFFYIPLVNIVKFAFFSEKGFSLQNIFHIITDSYIVRVLIFTFKEAFVSALVTLIIALPGAYIISHFRFRGKNFLVSLSTIPFVLPSVLVALGFILLFGKSGIVNSVLNALGFHKTINLLYSFWGIILVHAFYNFPIPLRIIGAAWESLPEKYSYAAFSLGANRLETFLKVILPLLLPAIISAFTLVFMFCFLSFVIILTIGGAKFATLEVSIYTYYNMFFDFKTGSALAFLQALFTLIFIYLYMKTGMITARITEEKKLRIFKNLSETKTWRILTFIYLIFIFPVIFLPLFAIFLSAFMNPFSMKLTLMNFFSLFSGKFQYVTSIGIFKIILNSFLFAIFAMFVSDVLAILVSYSIHGIKRFQNFFISILMLPIAISPVTIAFAYIITFRNMNFIINSWIIIAVAHTIIAFPFALRTLYSSIERMPGSMVFAAESLGLNRIRSFFCVDLPLLKPSIIVSSVFTFAISLGEFGATFMLYKNPYITMPVALYRFISGRHFGVASAMGSVLFIFAFISFALLEKFKKEVSVI